MWPVCHIVDNTSLYLALVRAILGPAQSLPDSGKRGYYLASSGGVAWEDLYAAIAASLARRKVVDDDAVALASDRQLDDMAVALGCPKELVPLQLGGRCTFTARHGEKLGWKPQYPPQHILDTADDEVELVLAHLED